MPGSSPTLRIGLIGVGFGAKVHAPAFQSEGCEITAVVARRPERAEAAKVELGAKHALTDFREMMRLDEIDAVAIASPPAEHREMVLAALAAGKHVLCEKPFALNVAEAVEMSPMSFASPPVGCGSRSCWTKAISARRDSSGRAC